MKKTVALILSVAMLATLLVFNISAETLVDLVPKESEWEYVVYEESGSPLVAEAPEGWLDGTDSAQWEKGQAPFAGSSWPISRAKTVFSYGYFSAFLRKTFTVEDVSAISEVMMKVIYDENPHVYINGVEVWSAEGYRDADYITVDASKVQGALKDGENIVCVYFSNVVGGSGFDMCLSANIGEIAAADEEGNIYFDAAECGGIYSFTGNINIPENVLDNDQNTVCGSGYDPNTEQWVKVSLKQPCLIDSVSLRCKNEGTTTNSDGFTRGTYDIYTEYEGVYTLVATGVPARTYLQDGYTVKLTSPRMASAIKVVISSWQGSAWACVADISAKIYDSEEKPFNPDLSLAAVSSIPEEAGKISVVGTILTDSLNYENVRINAKFYNAGTTELVNEKEYTTTTVYKTLRNLASTDAVTAEAQKVILVDGSYIFGMSVTNVPAGTYDVVITVWATDDAGNVVSAPCVAVVSSVVR